MLPKASQNDAPNPQTTIEKSIAFSIKFFIRCCIDFCLILQPPDPRFNCYLQRFRGVQHFSQTLEITKKRLQKSFQNDTQIDAKSLQKSMKKQIPKKNQKNMKNEPKMEPKGLPEFPGKSRKSAPRRPGTTEERPGTPKGPPRHPTAAKMTSQDPKK